MKTSILISIFAFTFGSVFSQSEKADEIITSEFMVYGNCGMCKTRIEKAAKTEGVTSAVWDQTTKMLKVEYQPSKVKVETIHKNIAKVGHDTSLEKADDKVYNKLAGCCHYQRRAVDKPGQVKE